ncbi:MAG: porin family protein [Porticoccus sp.]|nr:porin family protein [Porticoccus sp.]MBQ0808375.1 porin family protein [Porticoccus sp.]
MNKKTLFIILASLSVLTTAHAESWYISGQVGHTQTEDADWDDSGFSGEIELDNTVNYGLAVGKRINKNVRAELELSYREADLDKFCADGFGCGSNGLGGELETTLLLANVYYDFMPNETWHPYLSAGVGVARHDGTLSASNGALSVSASGDDNVFAYQLGAGISYDASERVQLVLGYRYLSSSDPEFASFDAQYDAQELNFAVRVSF